MSRRREIRRVQGSHTDDWLITYADTITLLLCLFVLLLASQARDLVLAQNLTHSAPPDQPMPAHVDQSDWKLPFVATAPELEVPGVSAYQEAEDRVTSPSRDVSSVPIAGIAELPAARLPSAGPPALVVTAEPVPAQQETSGTAPTWGPEIMQNLGLDEPVRIEPLGDRITTLAFDSAAFFNRGSATLSNSGKVILQGIVADLKSEEYLDYTATIEGHTDDIPINTTQFPSNWELSSARAAAVVRFLIEQGVSAQRLRAAGYADTRPLRPNRDRNGVGLPENQARNRRVVIGLEKIERH